MQSYGSSTAKNFHYRNGHGSLNSRGGGGSNTSLPHYSSESSPYRQSVHGSPRPAYTQGRSQSYASQPRSPRFSDEEEDEEDELADDDRSDDDSDNGGPPQSASSSYADHHASPLRSFHPHSPPHIGGLNYPPLSNSTSMHPSLGSQQSKASLRLPPLLMNADPLTKSPNKLPPIYTQFMREFSAAPPPSKVASGSRLPSSNPSSVPHETCLELRKQNIDPHWVVLPRFGDPCPFSDKTSCLRRDWRPAMWERHVQTHLPDSMKEFWECPHCFRPFNRKCAFVNHLRKTRTECGVKGTLDQMSENLWREQWFHEPMPLRYPDGDIQRRKWQNRPEED